MLRPPERLHPWIRHLDYSEVRCLSVAAQSSAVISELCIGIPKMEALSLLDMSRPTNAGQRLHADNFKNIKIKKDSHAKSAAELCLAQEQNRCHLTHLGISMRRAALGVGSVKLGLHLASLAPSPDSVTRTHHPTDCLAQVGNSDLPNWLTGRV